jgi:predicted metal-dependent peptidase
MGATFEQRFEAAKVALCQRYRWSSRTVMSLQPVERTEGTFSVDVHHRLYFNRAWSEGLTDAQFVGAVWHEANHLLRRHSDRFAGPHDHRNANIATDCEINGEVKVTLPDGVCYPELFDLERGELAESYYADLVGREKEQEQEQDGDGEQGDGDGNTEPQNDAKGSGDDKGTSDPNCGSGAGGDPSGEDPTPSDETVAETEREDRKQAKETVQAAKGDPNGYTANGPSPSVVAAAKRLLGVGRHDWRATFATVVRTALEQASDDAEDFTYRRRSRRAEAFPDILLPGSYRPVPLLSVVVDSSGSMNVPKVTAALTEVREILNRLALPSFVCHLVNTRCVHHALVRSESDVRRLLDKHAGGSTNMLDGIEHCMREDRPEVIVVLTDAQCSWDTPTPPSVPVIIGGIDLRGDYAPPSWTTTVKIESEVKHGA